MTPARPVSDLEIAPARRRPRGRKGMITAAARRLAAESGFAAVSLDDIAGQVGMTAGALYRHFPGRSALVEAVLTDVIDRFLVVAEAVADQKDGLHRLLEDTIALVLDDSTLLPVYLREHASVDSAELAGRELRVQDLWTRVIESEVGLQEPTEAWVRQRAVLGALEATSAKGALVPRPRIDELLIVSCLAVLKTPTSTRPGRQTDDVHEMSGDSGSQRTGWQPPPSRADAILDAALTLFRQKGFAGTGIDDIAASLGLAGSNIYRTYPSKAHVLLDAYDRAGARVAVGAERAVAKAGSATEALHRLAYSFASVAVDNTDLIVVTSREGAALPETERLRLSRRRKAVRDTWATVLRECRPELSTAETRLVVRCLFPLATEVALLSPRLPVQPVEVATLMVRFALASDISLTPTSLNEEAW